MGILTVGLAEKATQVISYEIDKSLQEPLEKVLKNKTNVKLIFADFLEADLSYVEENNYILVANLPYSITTPILFKIINEKIPFNKLVIMVQKEVGERIKAKEGSKVYNALSVILNHYYQIDKVMDVSRNVFSPKPKVDSVVLKLIRKEDNRRLDIKFVKSCFRQKRKILGNNIKGHLKIKEIEKILKKYELSLKSRAEQIPLEVFVEISQELGD